MNAKVLYLVTEDWYFCSHRLPIARAARDEGFDVVVATRVNEDADTIEREGFKLVPIRLRRRGQRPWRELASIIELAYLCRDERPSLIHQIAMKPIIYGSFAAAITGVPAVVSAIAGLGYVFTAQSFTRKILRSVVRVLLRGLLASRRNHVIVQNSDDSQELRRLGVPDERIHLIPGAGIDVSSFLPSSEPLGGIIATMLSRMLWDKGVGELVEAARLLKGNGLSVQVQLVGTPDPENPSSVPESQLRAWDAEGLVDWMGWSDDPHGIWTGSHIAVLPSYREGLPKSLLEAAACGRPLVATDVPGCRDVVIHEETGLLVPARDPQALAEAIVRLAGDPGLRARLGKAARERVKEHFSMEKVVEQTLALYRSILVVD